MARNIEQILNLLQSGKVKERTSGVELLDSLLSVPNKVEKLAESAHGVLIVLGALFSAFSSEKDAFRKKGSTGSSTAAENRLKAIAKTLRTLVERTHRGWDRKVLRTALEHLFENCKFQGALFEPVSLDYFHTISHLFRFRPHVDNLEHGTWIKLLDLMFNVILEDPFKVRLEDDPKPASRASSSMDVDDEELEDDEMASSSRKKRRRPESTPAPRSVRPTTKGNGAEVGKIKPVAAEIVRSLLIHPSSPLVSPHFAFLPEAVLNRMQRYLAAFSNKASLHRELLPALSTILSECSLNNAAAVARFARNAWLDLIDLWKIKDWRESLVVVLRRLFPYLTVENELLGELPRYDVGLRALYDCLEKDTHDAKFRALSIDCLRMQHLPEMESQKAFVAKTFRYGWKFTSAQALSWAILELQADCAAKLFTLFRSTLYMEDTGRKRIKREDPISALLSSIRTRTDVNLRVAHLQLLLFIIDRHWSIIHEELRQSVKDELMQLLSYDDADIQSWAFLCLAAVAHASCESSIPVPRWDDVWIHATREATIPRVCRAACHVAHTLLTCARPSITPNKVFSGIETLAKDLTIQGPTFPYDSVCTFLATCIRVASQDARLYRLQLEEKVLGWLLKSWKPTDPLERARMPAHTVSDINYLLEAVCNVKKQVDLICEMLLPECAIVDTVVEEYSTAVIRDFVLHTRLPPFRPITAMDKSIIAEPSSWTAKTETVEAPQGGKERRLSAFFASHLDKFSQEAERDPSSKQRGSAVESVRVALDFAVSALCFETMASAHGIEPNKRTMQLARRVIRTYLPAATDSRTNTWEDRSFILAALDPVVLAAPRKALDEPWETVLPPGRRSGIHRDVLHALSSQANIFSQCLSNARRSFQAVFIHNFSPDDDALIPEVLHVMRQCLQDVTASLPKFTDLKSNRGLDDDLIRLTSDSTGPVDAQSTILRGAANACIGALAALPMLKTGQPTRDKELFDFFGRCSTPSFILLGTVYAEHVQDGALYMNTTALSDFFPFVEEIGGYYEATCHDAFLLMVVSLLRATLHVWIGGAADNALQHEVRRLLEWVFKVDRKQSNISWRAADIIVQFLDDYLCQDPAENSWPLDGGDASQAPHSWLHELAGQVDIRVRLRAAVASARSFDIIQQLGALPMQWYLKVRDNLCNNTDLYEEMLTRMICLANIMVVNSAVRRGCYWNLLELCFFAKGYTRHIETILTAVSQRLGLPLVSFFEMYSGQIATTLRLHDHKFLELPPHLLGYRDLKVFAEATLPLFTPTNLTAGGPNREEEARGERHFKSHCQVLKKSIAEGLEDCLADVVGRVIVDWIAQNNGTEGPGSKDLQSYIAELVAKLGHDDSVGQQLRPYADGILVSILLTLDEADYSPSGPIIASLQALPEASTEVFCALTKFRSDTFYAEEAIVPAWPSNSVLQSAVWFDNLVPHGEDDAITYHVLHHLLARLERHPIVYEQLRLLNTVCIWVACRHEHFQAPALLKALFIGALNILPQSDLARGAQSVLDWIFGRLNIYRASALDLRLAEGLLRIGCIAHEYATSEIHDVSLMGGDMLEWIEQQLRDLHYSSEHEAQVLKALSAWPRELSDSLKQLCGHIGADDLSEYLRDDSLSTNKFRVVRQLQNLSIDGTTDDYRFAQADFWRLKSCIPLDGRLAMDDVHAFAELLLLNRGQIDGLEYEAPSSSPARSQHLDACSPDSSYHAAQIGSRMAIITSLLSMLHAPSASEVYLAFRTLRSLTATASSDAIGTAAWPQGRKAELSYLQAYSSSCPPPPPTTLSEVLATDIALELAREFPDWIKFLASAICDFLATEESFYTPLSAALHTDARLAEEVLPMLAHAVLLREREQHGQKTDPTPTRLTLSNYFTRVLGSSCASVSCRRVIVDIVLHLRQTKCSRRSSPLSHEKWLDLDFILLSQSAISYGAYTTALLFTELAGDFSTEPADDFTSVEQVLYEIYRHIDEPDGFYGIKSHDPHRALLRRFHHEDQWQKAFQFHGASIDGRFSAGSDVQGVLRALDSFGFSQLALTTLQAVPDASDDLTSGPMAYHLGWRTETWDLPERPGDEKISLYMALRAVHRERDEVAIEATLERTLTQEMRRLHSLADENITEIREVAQNLLCLNEIRHWRNEELQGRLRASINWTAVAELGSLDPDLEYPFLEALTATRISLLHSARYKQERGRIGNIPSSSLLSLVDAETGCLLRLSEASRKAGNVQVALNSVVRAQKLCSTPRFDVSHEYARVLWLSQEPRAAVQYLADLLNTSIVGPSAQDTVDACTIASVYAALGTWASEACLEKPADIKTRYFDKAADLALREITSMTRKDTCRIASVLHQYAIFAERQYTSIVKSPDVFRWRIYVGRKEEELKQWDAVPKDHASGRSKAEKVLAEDRARLQEYDQQQNAFLVQALEMYSCTLQYSDDFDDYSIIRFCSLWFANFDRTVGDFQGIISQMAGRISSRKFVFLAHQLSARLSRPEKSSGSRQPAQQGNLRSVVLRMCREHPFHALYPVFCLRGDSKLDGSRRQSARNEPISSQAERVAAADDIFQSLLSDPQDPQCQERVKAVELVYRASLEWAQHPVKNVHQAAKKAGKRSPSRVPPGLQILSIKDMKVPVTTAHLPVDTTCRYDSFVWISRFEDSYATAGGINIPKITKCVGSDGHPYKQLYKGEGGDDLRQDAVMEQVFDLVNIVLRNDRQTIRRKLRIKGYKVIPLASQAGVIEFVENTRPLKDWLEAAHSRYRPTDISHSEFFKQLSETHEAARKSHSLADRKYHERMFKLFSSLRTRFKPVMRHFFTEHHKVPIMWFRTRLNYARSVATTSIVGHILGLGDRHTSNILQDTTSGELVHIDLGIAFDQGKLLPVPERVPFRLTADIVDGLGTSGVDGVFRRCAEETLRVLRDEQEVILTVLEVFKYDPLHSWTASEMKLKQVQSSRTADRAAERTAHTSELTEAAFKFAVGLDFSAGTADESAERALGSVQRKLDKANSVEFTVNDLIQQATDTFNVANMYFGWCPHL